MIIGSEQDLADAVADGRLTPADADAVRAMDAFLRDVVPFPGRPVPMWLLRKHRDFLGLTDAQLARAEAARSCSCGPDRTGEAPDERPDCLIHGAPFTGPYADEAPF